MRKALILSFLAWGASAAIADVQPLDKTFVRRGVDPTARDTKVFDAPAQSTNAVTKGEYSLRDVDVQVGTSRYDYQHNGSHGKMLAVSSDGVVHGAYMGGTNVTTGRRVEAYCVGTDGSVTGPSAVLNQHTGYTTSAVTSSNPGNGLAADSGVIAFHSSVPSSASWINVDFAGCTLAFNSASATGLDRIWPHVAVDNQDRLHIICGDATTDSDDVWYRASSDGVTWDADWAHITDNSNTLSHTSAAAKTGPGAALIFMQDAPLASATEATALQWHHDLFYYRSNTNNLYGEISAGNMVNITNYRHPDSNAPMSDLTFAYSDVDAIFGVGANPQLHIAFSTPMVYADTAYYKMPGDDTINLVSGGESFANVSKNSALWHFNADTGEWGHIGGWLAPIDHNDVRPDPGVFRIATDRVQLAIDPSNGYLYAVWNEYFPDDIRDPWTDNKLMPNGEIFAACSADNGLTWGPRVNLTNTATPGCTEGNCASETFASVAEHVYDGELLLSYMLDLHAGSSIRSTDTNDGSAETVNPMIFTRIPVSQIPPHSGTAWDAAGKIGLSNYERSWAFSGADPDTAQILDRILLVNEGHNNVMLNSVDCYHSAIDVFGSADLYAEFEAWNPAAGDWYADAADWDGVVSGMDFHPVRVSVGHNGLPISEQAFKFTFSDGTVSWYRYAYYETAVVPFDFDNTGSYSHFTVWSRDTAVEPGAQPVSFELSQNFPNPFNPTTEISFSLANNTQVNLSVFNLNGQRIATLVDGGLNAGSHSVTFDASGLSSGVYFYTLQANGATETRKMVLTK